MKKWLSNELTERQARRMIKEPIEVEFNYSFVSVNGTKMC